MQELQPWGKLLMGAGLALLVLGAWLYAGGRVPGDIVIRRPGFTLYLPLGTCLLASLLWSLGMYLWRRFMG